MKPETLNATQLRPERRSKWRIRLVELPPTLVLAFGIYHCVCIKQTSGNYVRDKTLYKRQQQPPDIKKINIPFSSKTVIPPKLPSTTSPFESKPVACTAMAWRQGRATAPHNAVPGEIRDAIKIGKLDRDRISGARVCSDWLGSEASIFLQIICAFSCDKFKPTTTNVSCITAWQSLWEPDSTPSSFYTGQKTS